jgi:hypothetical protein
MAAGGAIARMRPVATEYRDRILSWEDELRRLAPDLPDLPEAARLAVVAVVAQFLREDAESGPVRLALDDAA